MSPATIIATRTYASIEGPRRAYATVYGSRTYATVYAPRVPVSDSGGISGQLYDETTGALLFDALTGAPITW